MAAVKLYGPLASTATSRALACLLEKQVEYELIPVDLKKGEHKKPPFLAMQPFGQVPVLQDGALTLYESRAIVRYIAEKYAAQGTRGLLGKNLAERAAIEQWMEVESQTYNPPSSTLVFQLAFAPLWGIPQNQAEIAKNEEKLSKALDVYEKRLSERTMEAISGNLAATLAAAAWCRSSVRASLPLLLGDERYDLKNCQTIPVFRTEVERYQIFVKLLSGKTILLWVSALDTGETLKSLIEQREGYPRSTFYLLNEGKALKVEDRMGDCQIQKNSTIHVMYRMRGGTDRNRGTAGPSSYKDAARPKGPKTSAFPPSTSVPMSTAQPRPYIVERLDEIPSLEVKNPEVKELFSTLQTHALICRFNGYWPRSYDLHKWIYTNWTIDCQILLCSKGFFIVQFEKQEDCQKVITQGPWFWGRAGLFITPWFPEFDANSMVVTKMPVWVRLPNLPLPFWHHLVLEDIGNLLGTFIKRDPDRNDQGLFTYARICVEIDLSKGLPDRIHLQYEKFKWLQVLDYENTAFRCRFCHDTGHLQDTCPIAKRYPKKKKGMNTRGKTWQSEYAPYCSEESEDEESEPEEQQKKEERAENWQNPDPMVERKSETKTDGKKTPLEPVMDASLDGTNTVNPMDDYKGEGTQTAIVIQEKAIASGVKRGHESEKSDSDKEQPPKQIPEMVNGRQLVIATTSQGRWVEVKNKKKGKKGKIEAYYKP